jgi:hypothetical protein
MSGRYGTSAFSTNRGHNAFVTQFTFNAFHARFGKTNSLRNFTRSRCFSNSSRTRGSIWIEHVKTHILAPGAERFLLRRSLPLNLQFPEIDVLVIDFREKLLPDLGVFDVSL